MTGSEERLYGQSGARQLDRVATSRYGLGSGELMGRAGAAAFRVLRRRWPEAMSIMIVCGPGNNGGDGYVIGRLAHSSGLKTIIVAVAAPATDEALQARDQAEQAGVCIEQFSGGELPDADLLIDCILGTGMKRPPAGDIATTIEALNRLDRPVMAVDMPSGGFRRGPREGGPCGTDCDFYRSETGTLYGPRSGCVRRDRLRKYFGPARRAPSCPAIGEAYNRQVGGCQSSPSKKDDTQG